ncbi:hypothetical protein [Pseudoalteromonas rubra]|uniref:Uncharacterized protein n=1 Tax=Pseudoalteromonas rubra TaxID=43658 RepID=A0A0F4QXD0_9GAMM|nr:hypothetical protein [Pseudoalteromonas rubra]KJZ12353.1 hypothetical protein TW77_03055 [Pseudoalteromonas rubra]
MKPNKLFLAFGLVCENAWAWRYSNCSGSCSEFLRTISGGNTGILALEIALFVFVVLTLFIKLMEKWHK